MHKSIDFFFFCRHWLLGCVFFMIMYAYIQWLLLLLPPLAFGVCILLSMYAQIYNLLFLPLHIYTDGRVLLVLLVRVCTKNHDCQLTQPIASNHDQYGFLVNCAYALINFHTDLLLLGTRCACNVLGISFTFLFFFINCILPWIHVHLVDMFKIMQAITNTMPT